MNTILLISSCNAFSDCWRPLMKSIRDCWPDCPYPVYLITNGEPFNDPLVHILDVGTDCGWGSNFRMAESMLPNDVEYIIYLQDDFFLCKRVFQEEMNRHIDYMIRRRVDYLRLAWAWRSGMEEEGYVLLDVTTKYNLCLQVAIWRRDLIRSIVEEGWSGWDYEALVHQLVAEKNLPIKAAIIREDDFYRRGIEYVCATGIRKGRWTNSGYRFLEINGFVDLLAKRKKEPAFIGFCERHHNPMTRACFLLYFKLLKLFK